MKKRHDGIKSTLKAMKLKQKERNQELLFLIDPSRQQIKPDRYPITTIPPAKKITQEEVFKSVKRISRFNQDKSIDTRTARNGDKLLNNNTQFVDLSNHSLLRQKPIFEVAQLIAKCQEKSKKPIKTEGTKGGIHLSDFLPFQQLINRHNSIPNSENSIPQQEVMKRIKTDNKELDFIDRLTQKILDSN